MLAHEARCRDFKPTISHWQTPKNNFPGGVRLDGSRWLARSIQHRTLRFSNCRSGCILNSDTHAPRRGRLILKKYAHRNRTKLKTGFNF